MNAINEIKIYLCVNDLHLLNQLNDYSYHNNDFNIVGSFEGNIMDIKDFNDANVLIIRIHGYSKESLSYIKQIKALFNLKVIALISRDDISRLNGINDVSNLLDKYIIGAYYFNELVNCIMDLKKTIILRQNKQLSSIITNTILSYRIPINFRGFQYLKTALILLNSDNYANGYKVMELYKEIALINKTTASRVEKALRYAIKESNLDDKMKCHEFILTLNAKVILEKEKDNE